MNDSRRLTALGVAVGFEGSLAVIALALNSLMGLPSFNLLALDPSALFLGLVAAVPLLVLFALGVNLRLGPLERIRQFLQNEFLPFLQPCTTSDLALIALCAGLGEELLFRGVIQGGLGEWLGRGAGLALASLLFGLVHCITLTYAIFATGVGVYLGWLWIATQSLPAVILTHACYDFVALLYLRGLNKR